MEKDLVELKSYLRQEFEIRAKLNPLYSQRAFSRDLGISATSLGDFLSGKRSLNFSNIDKVFKYLRKKSAVTCSWCSTPKAETKKLISGPHRQYICSTCVDACNEILRADKKSKVG